MKRLFNVANILTLFRIALTPIFLWLFFSEHGYLGVSIVVFSIAAFTDLCDGYIARRYDHTTELGSFLDPIADKALIGAVFFAFYRVGLVPLWFLGVLVVRDVMVTGLRMVLSQRRRSLVTSQLAKWKTFLQFMTIYVLFAYLMALLNDSDSTIALVLNLFIDPMLYALAGLTVYSAVEYVIDLSDYAAYLVASCCHLGGVGIMPGTVGSMAALLVFYGLNIENIVALSILLLLIFFVGVRSCSVLISSAVRPELIEGFERHHVEQYQDPSWMVIDEFFGMGVALFLLPHTFMAYGIAFVLFRFFDIVKPFPINRVDAASWGGWSVMLDDFLAGIFACALTHGILWFQKIFFIV